MVYFFVDGGRNDGACARPGDPIVKDLILDMCIGVAWALLVMAIVLISVGHTTRFIYAAF